MRVIVTGSRDHKNPDAVWKALDGIFAELHPGELMVVVEGGADGVDTFARNWTRFAMNVRPSRVKLETHKADWSMGKQAGHWRNQHMVNLDADLCLAFPWPGAGNRGTADCARRAREAGIEVREIPEGIL